MDNMQDFAYALLGVLMNIRTVLWSLTAATAVVAAAVLVHALITRKRRKS